MDKDFLLMGTEMSGVFKISYPSFGDFYRGADKLFEVKESNIFSELLFTFDESMLMRSKKGVLRGMHYQSEECKRQDRIISIISGGLYVVVVDLGETRDSYGNWMGFTVTENEKISLYVPGDYAIGTLAEQDSVFIMFYSGEYLNGFDRGFRYDDHDIGIEWPSIEDTIQVSERDSMLPCFADRDK